MSKTKHQSGVPVLRHLLLFVNGLFIYLERERERERERDSQAGSTLRAEPNAAHEVMT